MKRHDLLLPYRFKMAGWVILGAGVLLWAIWLLGGTEWDFSINNIRALVGMSPIVADPGIPGLSRFTAETGLMETVTSVLIILGAYLAGFSRCKDEDEFTEHLRYRSLTVMVVALMAIELVLTVFCYGFNYLICQNMLVKLAPMFYVIYFYILVVMERRRDRDEE